MANRLAVDSGWEPLLLPFAFAGLVSVWDPIHRHLEIGPRAFGVAPSVTVAGLATGVRVTVGRYVEPRPIRRPAGS